MKEIEKIWIPATIIVAGLVLFFVFGESDRIREAKEKERNIILQTDPKHRARDDASNGISQVFKVWRKDEWFSPGIGEEHNTELNVVFLESTRTINLYNDSSEYRRNAERWAAKYNREAVSIWKSLTE